MASVHCSLTGEPTLDPVLCTATGYVFERGVIRQYLLSRDTCPFTHRNLDYEKDFVSLKTIHGIQRHRLSNGKDSQTKTLADGLVAHVQMGVKLKQEAVDLKNKLTKALIQQAASLKLIRKISAERDELRQRLFTVSKIVAEDIPIETREHIAPVLRPEDSIVEEISTNAVRLNVVRKELNQNKSADAILSHVAKKTSNVHIPTKKPVHLGSFLPLGDIWMHSDKEIFLYSSESGEVITYNLPSNLGSIKPLLLPYSHKINDAYTLVVVTAPDTLSFYTVPEPADSTNQTHHHHHHQTLALQATLTLPTDILAMAAHPLDHLMAVLSPTDLYIVDLRSHSVQITMQREGLAPSDCCLDLHPDGKLVFVGGDQAGVICVGDIVRKEWVLRLGAEEQNEDKRETLAQQQKVKSNKQTSPNKPCGKKTGKNSSNPVQPEPAPHTTKLVRPSQNGYLLLTLTHTGVLTIFDLRTGLPLPFPPSTQITDAAFTPRGNGVVTRDACGDIAVWTVEEERVGRVRSEGGESMDEVRYAI